MVDISVCIPVFGTERYLKKCLESVALQTFPNYEIILVNDGSSGFDDSGLNCKKIVKECKKRLKLPITYIEHSKNCGVLEARRRAVEDAKGTYILNLDSDDVLMPDALEVLYAAAKESDADIVQGLGNVYLYPEPEEQVVESKEKIDERQLKIQKIISNIYDGVLENRDIFDGYVVKNNHCGYLCAKLIRKDIYIEALNHIPRMFCVMADDVIQYFWISYFAKKYISIKKEVYIYTINTGISSHKVIRNLNIWKHVCSASSVFSALFNELEKFDIGLTEEEANKITSYCYMYAYNNISQLNKVVAPEIKDDAYEILCDYWGEDIIHNVQSEINLRN